MALQTPRLSRNGRPLGRPPKGSSRPAVVSQTPAQGAVAGSSATGGSADSPVAPPPIYKKIPSALRIALRNAKDSTLESKVRWLSIDFVSSRVSPHHLDILLRRFLGDRPTEKYAALATALLAKNSQPLAKWIENKRAENVLKRLRNRSESTGRKLSNLSEIRDLSFVLRGDYPEADKQLAVAEIKRLSLLGPQESDAAAKILPEFQESSPAGSAENMRRLHRKFSGLPGVLERAEHNDNPDFKALDDIVRTNPQLLVGDEDQRARAVLQGKRGYDRSQPHRLSEHVDSLAPSLSRGQEHPARSAFLRIHRELPFERVEEFETKVLAATTLLDLLKVYGLPGILERAEHNDNPNFQLLDYIVRASPQLLVGDEDQRARAVLQGKRGYDRWQPEGLLERVKTLAPSLSGGPEHPARSAFPKIHRELPFERVEEFETKVLAATTLLGLLKVYETFTGKPYPKDLYQPKYPSQPPVPPPFRKLRDP